MNRHTIGAVAAAATLALGLSACGSGPTSSDDGGTEEVTYLTSFNTFGRDAYVYVAEEKGYFDEAGLDVDIQPGTGTVDVLKLVASGRADFGTGDFSTTVVTIGEEKLPVTAVAAIHQRSLAALVTLDGYGIEEPKDLEGKTVGDQPGSTNQVIFPVYAEAAGIDAAKVKFVPSSPPSLPQLLASHKVDAIGQFVVARGLIESAAQGKKAVFLPYGDVLPDLYGNVLAARAELVEQNPELVAKFTQALLKGLEYSIENPEETGEILAKHQPTQNPQVAAGEVTAMKDYVTGDGALGSLEEERVQKIIDLLAKAEAVQSDLAPQDVADFDVSGTS